MKVGFKQDPDDRRRLIFDIASQTLPTVGINQKNPGKKNILGHERDRKHMLDIVSYAQNRAKSSSNFARVPVAARIVDGEGNVIVDCAYRKIYSKEKPYGIKSRHAEIEAIREAEKRGFNDWKNATLYVNIQPCYHCSRAIGEFYGFKRVVYGMEDVTLSAPDLAFRILHDNGVETQAVDDDIKARVEPLFRKHIDLKTSQVGKIAEAYGTWREYEMEVVRCIKTSFGDNLQVCVFNADLWKEIQDKDAQKKAFSVMVWFNHNMNPQKEQLLIIVGSESNYIEAKAKIVEEKLFDSSKIILSRPDTIINQIIEKAAISDIIKDQGRESAISENMERIHEINMSLLPPVENGKTLWHVIPEEIIPRSIRANFVNMISDMNRTHPDLREKIKIVTNRQYLHAVIAKLVSDPNNIVDAAVADRKDLEELPEGIKALVFEGKLGDFRQLEGILAALRALQQNNTKAIIALYEILTGKLFSGSEKEVLRCIEDPRRLADIIIFDLKPIEAEDYEELNLNLHEFIEVSA